MTGFEIISLKDKSDLADVCAAWDFAEWGCMESGITLDATLRDYGTKRAEQDLPATWVGLCGGRPSGMVRLRYNDHPDHTDINPWLGSLYVHSIYRGRGLGRALVEAVRNAASKTFGFKTLYLYTPDAEDFYARMGWRRIGTVRDPRSVHAAGDALMQIDL